MQQKVNTDDQEGIFSKVFMVNRNKFYTQIFFSLEKLSTYKTRSTIDFVSC